MNKLPVPEGHVFVSGKQLFGDSIESCRYCPHDKNGRQSSGCVGQPTCPAPPGMFIAPEHWAVLVAFDKAQGKT